MVNVWSSAALVASLSGSIVFSESTFQPMSMQLHRLPLPAVRSETYQRRRMIGLDANSNIETVPLNPGMGTHYAWVYVGTPPQRASVITDTGSSILAFPCSGCANCGQHTDQPFAALNSSTLEHVSCSTPTFFHCKECKTDAVCKISQSYVEGSSWSATVVDDIVFLGDQASANDVNMRNQFGTRFKFGCQSSETGLFISQVADGIMGLANNDHHVVAKLFQEQKIPSKLFTLCFATDGGSMSIGAPDPSIHKGTVQYAKIVPHTARSFYGVELRDVRISGISIEASPASLTVGHFIVDSGTTDSYLPSSMADAFNTMFQNVSGMEYHASSGSCNGYSDADLAKLPTIEFVLGAEDGGNMTLTVTPEQYLYKSENGQYCSSVYLTEGSGGVIGANIMMNRDVIFDQGKQRVGFVDADCKYRRLETTNTTTSTNSISNSTTTGIGASSNGTALPTTGPTYVSTNGTVATTVPLATPTTTAYATTAPANTIAPTSTPNATVPVTVTPNATGAATATPNGTVLATTTPNTTAPTIIVPTTTTPATTGPATTVPATTVPATTVPATTSPVPTTVTPQDATQNAPAVTTPTPAPTTVKPKYPPGKHVGVHAADTTTEGAAKDGNDGDHPMILTVVGSILAVAFLVIVAASVKRHKKKKRQSWSRVNEDDVEEDDDEEGLIEEKGERQRSPKRRAVRRRSDDFDDEDSDHDDDDHIERGGRFHDEDEDEDDEIFAGSTRAHAHGDEHKHDTRMLERL